MDNQSDSNLQTNSSRKGQTSQQNSRLHRNRAAEGEEPRTNSKNNKRPPGASPTPAGREQHAEAESRTADNQSIAENTKISYKKTGKGI